MDRNTKRDIYNCGKELFCLLGYRKTNVAAITQKADIAAGTFYNYYTSKDSLFMEIYLEENRKLKKDIMEAIDLKASPMDVMKKMMHLNHQGMIANPILKEWYNREIFRKLEKNFCKENGLDSVNFLYGSFLDIIKKWQEDGKMRKDLEGEMIMALFSAIINADLHKEEIGIQYFPELLEHLAEFTMKGLTEI